MYGVENELICISIIYQGSQSWCNILLFLNGAIKSNNRIYFQSPVYHFNSYIVRLEADFEVDELHVTDYTSS